MPAAVRSFVATGLVLIGTGAVVAGQIVTPLQKSEARVIEAAVNLVAAVSNDQACSGFNTEGCDIWATPSYTPVAADPNGSASNIPANLLNAIIGIPRAWVDGLNELSYALEVTGNWWVYSPTNVLGFDPADPPKITAMVDQVIPFKPLSHAIGNQLAWWARANLPMNASCTGTVGPACSDVGPIFGDMFKAPIWTLASGYQFPKLDNPVSDAEGALGEEIPGETGQPVPWSGAYVKLNTSDWVTSVTNYLQADPATNAPKPITADEIGATLDRFFKALVLAFNPWVPRSYLLKGWPYTALSPLFTPFVPIFCKTCNPDNPGGPPLVEEPKSAAAEVAPAELVSATVAEPAAPGTGGTPAVGVAAGAGKRDNGPAGRAEGTNGDGPADKSEVSTATGTSEPDTDVEAGSAAGPGTDVEAGSAAGPGTDVETGSATTSTPASRTSAARAGLSDLAPAEVAAPADTPAAPSQPVSKPHRGASAHTSAATGGKDQAGTSSARGSAADKSSE